MSGRLLITGPMIFAGALSAASGQTPQFGQCTAKKLSALDYLALSSMADSQRPLAMAAYRPQPEMALLPSTPQAD